MASAGPPISVEETIHNEGVLHRIALSRFSTTVVRRVIAQLNRVELDVLDRLLRADNQSLTSQRLEILLAEVRAIETEGWVVVNERVTTGLSGVAAAEITFETGIVQLAATAAKVNIFSPGPTLGQVMAAVSARPFQGRLLREWLSGTEAATAARVRETIRAGFIEGRTTSEIVRTLRGTKANQFKDGILEASRRGTEAMVRTAVNHTANVAHQAVYEANKDIVAAWRFVATLDSRTTIICAGLHGKEFPVGTGPQPPRHINCRSISVPVVAPIPGVKPYVMPSYEAWLRKQPASVQDDILGATKGKLFRSGGLQIDQFTDKTGKVLTLEQLRARDASAFVKAGVDKAA